MINFVRYLLAFIIFSLCIVFTIIAATANWTDERLMQLAEKVAPS